MAQEICDVLLRLAEIVGAGACGGLVVLLFDHRLAIARGNNKKRERFRSYIELLRRKIESTRANLFVHDFNFSIRDVPKFDDEVLEVRPNIRAKNVNRFDDACTAYKTVRFGDFGDEEKNQKAKEKLVSLLGDIWRIAK